MMLYLDLDDSLITSVFLGSEFSILRLLDPDKAKDLFYRSEKEKYEYLLSKGGKASQIGNDIYISFKRPYCDKFLQEVAEFNPVILTSGLTHFQTQVIKKLDINLPLYGRDLYNQVPKHNNPLLIDNLWYSVVHDKLKAIGVEPNEKQTNFIQIKSWYGDPADNILSNFSEIVKNAR